MNLLEETMFVFLYERYGKQRVKDRLGEMTFIERISLQEAINEADQDKAIGILCLESGDNPYSSARPGSTPVTNTNGHAATPSNKPAGQSSAPAPDSKEKSNIDKAKDAAKTSSKDDKPDATEVDRKDLSVGDEVIAVDKDGKEIKGKVTKNSFAGVSIDTKDQGTVDIDRSEKITFKMPPGDTRSQIRRTSRAIGDYLDQNESIARMKELAGIGEMSSGGATGAGAVASAPAAVGDTISRTGKTKRKRKPKK